MSKMLPNISTLIPIYCGNSKNQVKRAVDSILNQSLKPDEIVIVLDGPVNEPVKNLIENYKSNSGIPIKIVKIEENTGISNALNIGLRNCSNEIVARMDADDIAETTRLQNQLTHMLESNLDVVGTQIREFSAKSESFRKIRSVPLEHVDIVRYSKKRNPINHMTVLYKKSQVLSVGGYSEIIGFEDYYLWLMMIDSGFKFGNTGQCEMMVQTDLEMYGRRGGFRYIVNEVKFELEIYRNGIISFRRLLMNLLCRIPVRFLPNNLRSLVYRKFLRVM